MNTFKRYTLTEVKEAHASIGGKFFTKDAMAFFSSHIETVPNKANIFITSEKNVYYAKRRYTLRWFNHETCEIDTLGPFMGYDDIETARLGRKRWTEIKLIQHVKSEIDEKRERIKLNKQKVLEDGKAILPIHDAIEVSESLAHDGILHWAFTHSDTHLLVELDIKEEN